jgi:hypothetical protein
MKNDGSLEGVKEQFRLERQGGYSGLHFFEASTLFLSQHETLGSQGFLEENAKPLQAIARALGHTSLPAASSYARLAGGIPEGKFRDFERWLLQQVPNVDELKAHWSCKHRDARSDQWDVFDYDPTSEALLQRPLKKVPDGPEPRRESARIAAPGHLGRKRGDVVFRRSALQHVGTGLWLECCMGAGKGDLHEWFPAALKTAREFAGAPARILIRMDGEFGGAFYARECQKAGVDFLARISKYSLLEWEEVQDRLNKAEWWPVKSNTGVPRFAADLGRVVLHSCGKAEKEGCQTVEPIEVRVVVIRSACGEKAHKGMKVGNEQIEILATSLEPEAWPAADVAELYQGRSSIENRFAQEDREFHLDRIFCYRTPGQEMVTCIGLFLWNRQVALALQSAGPLPTEPPPLQRRASSPVSNLVPLFPERIEREAPPDATVVPNQGECTSKAPTPEETPQVAKQEPPPDRLQVIETMEACLDLARWDTLMPLWMRERGKLQLRCPEGRRLKLFFAEHTKLLPNGLNLGQNRAGYRTESGTCDGCSRRTKCTTGTKPNTYKTVTRALPLEAAKELRAQIECLRKMDYLAPVDVPRSSRDTLHDETRVSRPNLNLQPPSSPGPYEIVKPRFSPREARKLAIHATTSFEVEIHVTRPPPVREAPKHPLIHPASYESMPARSSWHQRLARYALPADWQVEIIRKETMLNVA